MQVLKQGTKSDETREDGWWTGKIGTCSQCGTEIRVESGDRVMFALTLPNKAMLKCPGCKDGYIWVQKSFWDRF